MKKFLFVSFIITLFVSCKKQYAVDDFRKDLRPYLERLSKEKSISSSDTIAKKFLEKNATKEELIKLIDAKSPLLRVVAYRAIVNRNEPEYFDILVKHLNDTAKVTWWYYEDAGGVFTVSDLMIRKAWDKNGLSPIQKKVLIENVLLRHPYLDVSNWMIQDTAPDEKYYSLIKKRAEVKTKDFCNQLAACYALSKFKKKQDVELLYNVFKENINGNCDEKVFRSIEKFSDPKFFDLLNIYFNKNIRGKFNSKNNIDDEILYFTRAVAAYKNNDALEILDYIEKNNTYINKPFWPPSNKLYVYKATMIHYDTIYDNILSNIKKEMDPCDLKMTSSYLRDEIRNEDSDW